MSTVAKAWYLHPHDADAIARLAGPLRVSPIVAQLLLNRGLSDPADARRFLDAPLTDLHPPQALPGATEAAQRLARAIEQKRRVCVYGDYDVDGITGSALLWRLLRHLGADAAYYIPNRLEDGYGLHGDTLRRLAGEGVALVVTVDCGIAGVAEAALARELGLELLVTDHHEPKELLPAADVLVHPRLPGSAYPFGGLSGAGVAFKVAWALAQHVCGGEKVDAALRDFLLDAVALTALGLIADVVPLQDENRVFVRHGLARLQAEPPVGLRALMEVAGLAAGATPRAEDVSFKLAPRLNAAGRLGSGRVGVELLTATCPVQARELALFLDGQNRQRQEMERRVTEQVRAALADLDVKALPALVLAGVDWHPGIIGIVAGRLADQYARPVVLIAKRDGAESAPGSGRSVPGFALHEALRACSGHLLRHGGHAAAAGLHIAHDRIDAFREQFYAHAAAHFPAGPPAPQLLLDAEVPLSALTFGLLRDLDRLEPYGARNPRPRLLAGGLRIVGEPRRMGVGERHLSFKVRQAETSLRAVAFGMGDRLDELMAAGGACCLAFTPKLNEWNGSRTVEMEVADFQAGPVARLG